MDFNFNGYVTMDQWLDDYAGNEYQGEDGPNFAQDWARIAKIAEETGEVIQAFIGATGQNPRKGYEGSMDDVLNELADTFFTCLLAIQHFTKDGSKTRSLLHRRWSYRLTKMHNAIATAKANHAD